MITKTLNSLEYNKILALVSNYAVLEDSKTLITNSKPTFNYNDAKKLLDMTAEAYKLLYTHGVYGVTYFDKINDELEKSTKNSTLSFGELLKVASLLRSSRVTRTSILNVNDDTLTYFYEIASNLFYDESLEYSITSKILSDTTIADNASQKLYEIRSQIRLINEKIRERLASYMRQGANKYLQDNIVSIRSGRYVVPVKSEHLHNVKGFIHDRSQSGSTFFVEPQEILDLNNELRTLTINEGIEIEKILQELTLSVSLIANNLQENISLLTQLDVCFSKAEYSFKTKGIYPKLTSNGETNIINGRHPLISKEKVVPISLSFGKDYNFILISGPNTGGKTVTLKLVGLFCLMASSGLYLPCYDGSSISIFNNVFVDIGDEQSIEQNLSTFSSHIKNITEILSKANSNSLVLIDELGAGTDPDEGSALATAITKKLINLNAYGIITTHYSALKEFAYTTSKIVNASMDFDSTTFAPLYKLRIGAPGISNAIEIANRLGLHSDIIIDAKNSLSMEKVAFENVLRNAEIIRSEAEKSLKEIDELKEKQKLIYNELTKEREKLNKDKENFLVKAKAEARKLVNERLETAEELLEKMKDIFNKEEYYSKDLVNMSTLKNKIENEKYVIENSDKTTVLDDAIDIKQLKVQDKVYVKSLDSIAEVTEINLKNNSVWVNIGSIRTNVKISDLSYVSTPKTPNKKPTVSLKRSTTFEAVKTEINVIGLDTINAIKEVELFLDKAITSNLEEVRIVHGKGLQVLSTAIHKFLKEQNYVDSFRFGKYGEGEHGVTIVKLK